MLNCSEKRSLAGQPLRVSLTPNFAEIWLMPRLGSFWADHPEIEIALMPSPQLVDLRRDSIDIAIRYGNGHCEREHRRAKVSRLSLKCCRRFITT